MIVPNEPPTSKLAYSLALIGEAPGADEDQQGRPFCGASGRYMRSVLTSVGINQSACLIGNICQHRPPENKISKWGLSHANVQEGLSILKDELAKYNPNLVVLMGAYPTRATGVNVKLVETDDDEGKESVSGFGITQFRGTLFVSNDISSPFYGYKCLSTIHPAAVLRKYRLDPLFKWDLARARKEATTRDLILPNRTYEVDLTCHEIVSRLDAIRPSDLVALDIEGGINQGVECISFATEPLRGFIVNHRDFGPNEQLQLFRAMGRVVCDPNIPKVLQNSLYDNFVLSWLWKMPVRGVVHDTMLSGWERYPELSKSLGTQVSIKTKEPFYKFERKINDKRTHYIYCIKDSCVTHEICSADKRALSGTPLNHYQFNVSLLNPLLYMELRGIKRNNELCAERLAEVKIQMAELRARINVDAGCDLNPSSPKQMCSVLYDKIGFEPQFIKEGNRKTTKRTANQDALLTLTKTYNEQIIYNILKWRSLDGQRKQLEITTDADGRVRCTYNVVGTDTGRLSCGESPTGSGTNLQTITKKLRDLFIADKGKWFFQCDLSGADGWTVAAHCAELGDRMMLDDYLFGTNFKPAKVIVMMYEEGISISSLPRQTLYEMSKRVDKDGWKYFTSKRAQHGTSYLMGERKGAEVVLKDSYKISGEPITITPSDFKRLQGLFLARYPGIPRWQRRVQDKLNKDSQLQSASGHVRRFFGRKGDIETLKEGLAHEPQHNTTYATNLALSRLWQDPENRDGSGRLIIEPLHTVHDALCGQFPQDRAAWAADKIRTYFDNPIRIANQMITIPFEGAYGPSWGELPFTI